MSHSVDPNDQHVTADNPPIQGLLYPLDSPLPGNAKERDGQENELVQDAYAFLIKWIPRQGTAGELVEAMTEQFGYGIRGFIIDLIRRLHEDHSINQIGREYARSILTEIEVKKVIAGPEKKRELPNSTLDELFAQSRENRNSARFVEAVNFVSKLREYAPYNNMLVYLQRPTATFWATAKDWHRNFRRSIHEDAIPIIMLQPMGPVMLVYDVADTVGPPLPERFQRAFETSGDFDPTWLSKTLANCERAQIRVKKKRLGMLHAGSAIRSAFTSGFKLAIEINEDLEISAQYATLCHELAHIYLGHLGTDEDSFWPSRLGLTRNQRELEAEAVAYLVCRRAGLTTFSADYLAGYLSRPADIAAISVDMIMKVAGTVERMAKETSPSSLFRDPDASRL